MQCTRPIYLCSLSQILEINLPRMSSSGWRAEAVSDHQTFQNNSHLLALKNEILLQEIFFFPFFIMPTNFKPRLRLSLTSSFYTVVKCILTLGTETFIMNLHPIQLFKCTVFRNTDITPNTHIDALTGMCTPGTTHVCFRKGIG